MASDLIGYQAMVIAFYQRGRHGWLMCFAFLNHFRYCQIENDRDSVSLILRRMGCELT